MMDKQLELSIPDRVKMLVVNKFGARVFSRKELLDAYKDEYRDSPLDSVCPGDFCVNFKTRQWRKRHAFLFAVKKGQYRIYDPSRDGVWEVNKEGAKQKFDV
jgi:hypothetical protein